MTTAKTLSPDAGPHVPWWRIRMVWLVLGGPAAVVVAGIATAWIAIAGADTLVTAPSAKFADKPAVQGRNHSATAATAPAER